MDFHNLSKVRKLYKSILKLHKGLPYHLKIIGDTYARDEFKKHKHCKVQLEEVFIQEWANYAVTLTKQLGVKGPKGATRLGYNLTPDMVDSMSPDQKQTMNELYMAAQQNIEEEENDRTKK